MEMVQRECTYPESLFLVETFGGHIETYPSNFFCEQEMKTISAFLQTRFPGL